VLPLFLHLGGQTGDLLLEDLLHDGDQGVVLGDILRPRTLSAFFIGSVGVAILLPPKALEALIGLEIGLCNLMVE
jgi:hypothetical protein